MHEYDGTCPDALAMSLVQDGSDHIIIDWQQNPAVRRNALGNFDDSLIEHRRQLDLAGKYIRAILIADAQSITEALADSSSVRSPLRSSSALVATVVPILTASIRSAGMAVPSATPRISRIPCSAASA
jgi:hypothetical protein